MKALSAMNQSELGAYVQSQRLQQGIDTVLSGGAAVAAYTSGAYVTHHIDLVNRSLTRRALIKKAMKELGFREEGRHFKHPETPFLVEFPSGPLTVGDEAIQEIEEIKLQTGTLRVISRTDSVKDRLAWFYHSGDRQCLSQAVLIAQQGGVDLRSVEAWSRAEGKSREYALFRKQLGK